MLHATGRRETPLLTVHQLEARGAVQRTLHGVCT